MAEAQVEEASALLSQYLGKSLRVHTTDKRVFVGQMKCTDRECNIVLGLTQEYRPPAEDALQARAAEAGTSKYHIPFTSRYVGLVVVPGKHVTKIEQEEYIGGRYVRFASAICLHPLLIPLLVQQDELSRQIGDGLLGLRFFSSNGMAAVNLNRQSTSFSRERRQGHVP
jgi:small nuclear ribonucleoprotein (snRNP)-like protein